jgi:cyclophilin family peptidyl-prolyl cis-trans isomerase/HEAT repeat protein
MMQSTLVRHGIAALATAALAGCAAAPAVAPMPQAPQLTFEQKMAWILRLEEDRTLEAPEQPLPPPPLTVQSGRGRAAVITPPPPPRPSLLTLLTDNEARIRRRSALAVGRTRLAQGVEPLEAVLAQDAEPEVRQMAAFALGLIGDSAGADTLVTALSDADPRVQGRAAEGLGLLNDKASAVQIAAMMAVYTKAGVLGGIGPDDLEYPKPPEVEAVRLGMYALVRLSAYDELASVLLDPGGQPISRWWPVAYAFRRVNDPRAGSVLLSLVRGEGVITRAFAARGLGSAKERRALAPLVDIASNEQEAISVRIEAVRSLAELGGGEAVEPLVKIADAPKADPNLRLEAIGALGQLGASSAVNLLLDQLTERWPSLRSAALVALARIDPDTLLSAISGLEPDPHWSVRGALAAALGTLPRERAEPRLTEMLADEDQRVIPSVLAALVSIGSPLADSALVERLHADDHVVRQAAAAGLQRLKSPRAVAALTGAYERAEGDSTYVARAAILTSVVELDRDAARPLLQRALADRDWALRVRAAALLHTIDPETNLAALIRPAPAIGPPELNELGPMISPTVSPMAYIDTVKGMIQIELAVLDAPRTVANFVSLARRNSLAGTSFHRVVANFVAQDGDPRGDGEGGPGYTIRDEINQRPYLRGTVGMALDWEDTGGSQFFITHAPQPHLDGRYTVFGHVVAGMDVVDRLQQWDEIRSVRIWDGVNWIGTH